MIAQSIPELTNYEYNELSYNSAGGIITGNFMYQLCDLLNRCGIDVQSGNAYTDSIEAAVSEFQQKVNMKETGILTTTTLQAMIMYANKMDNVISDDEEDEDSLSEEQSDSPHYNSFFDDDKLKIHRRNHKDIKIVFGNKSITKTIKDVFMRSVSVEVDTSGNPIAEVYEFIARDVIESDEISDTNKYLNEEDVTALNTTYKLDYDFGEQLDQDFDYVSNVENELKKLNRSFGGGGKSFSGRTHSGSGKSF